MLTSLQGPWRTWTSSWLPHRVLWALPFQGLCHHLPTPAPLGWVYARNAELHFIPGTTYLIPSCWPSPGHLHSLLYNSALASLPPGSLAWLLMVELSYLSSELLDNSKHDSSNLKALYWNHLSIRLFPWKLHSQQKKVSQMGQVFI